MYHSGYLSKISICKLANTSIRTRLAFKICNNGKDKFSKQFHVVTFLRPESNSNLFKIKS